MDFTSALYLGMRHPARALTPWPALTLGAPAAVREVPGAIATAERLARLQGLGAGVLGVSTLHLLWDLIGVFADEGYGVLVDAGAYAVSKWAVERVRARAGLVIEFAHHDAAAARRMARRLPGKSLVILTDGYCPDCGETAPVGVLDALARERGGWLVCDDTQALGIHGSTPSPRHPYGAGGAGTLAFTASVPSCTLLVTSLAKAFGVPVAALSGPRAAVDRFVERSQTRMHCSPPSAAVIAAAQHALDVNEQHGDYVRGVLASRVGQFVAPLASAGMAPASRTLFPIQSLGPWSRREALAVQRRLAAGGVRAVLTRGRCRPGAFLSFLITARHTPFEVITAARLAAAAFQTVATEPATAARMNNGIRIW